MSNSPFATPGQPDPGPNPTFRKRKTAISNGLYCAKEAIRRFSESLEDVPLDGRVNTCYLSDQLNKAMNGLWQASIAVKQLEEVQAALPESEDDDADEPDTVLLPPAAQAGEKGGDA